MASNPFEAAHHGAAFFDIYNDQAAATHNLLPLPGGACNFVDLSPGANGARCGCRRFWIRPAVVSPTLDGAGWCMCNHHACFHDDGGHEPVSHAEPIDNGQENERPRTGREPLSPVVDVPVPGPGPGPDQTAALGFPSFGIDDALSFIYKPDEYLDPPGPSTAPAQPPPPSLPDTLPWSECIQTQQDANGHLLLPPQATAPSQTASTVSSVPTKYLKPFAGKGLGTLLGVTRGKPDSASQIPQSYKDPKLPSKAVTVEDSYVLIPSNQGGSSIPRPSTATQVEPRAQDSQGTSRDVIRNLSDMVSGHEQRLDRLETVSFSAAGHDECNDRYESTDLRLTHLESRMDDVDKVMSENNASRAGDDAASQSVASFSTTGTSRPAHSRDLYSQLESLQAQVNSLQAATPSNFHPWEVEVVFLPFPLKKVWQDIGQFKSNESTIEDGWTQLPMTNSTATLRSQSPFCGEWAGPARDAEWLLPKACSDKSVTDKRLRSRGLIQRISVKSPDARSIQAAMHEVFGSVWAEMSKLAHNEDTDGRSATFLGLRSSWVPLRKVHKDSRLRFLTPEEMVTPALWDVQFLTSVMMRSSEPRLFITHPDAYCQNRSAYEVGWSWQRIRELSRVYSITGGSQEVPEADAMEECWAWHEQLDEPLHAHTSLSQRHDQLRRSTSSPSQQYYLAKQSWRSSSPAVGFAQSSTAKGRRGSRPPHIRTASMPLNAPEHYSPMSRHRVVSVGQSRRSSPSVRATSAQIAAMYRRRTRSPSQARFTPRLTGSPSPMPIGLSDRQPARGTTPFTYNTPFSNAPLQEMRPMRGGSEAAQVPLYVCNGRDELDEDFQIQIYESGSDESFDDNESGSSVGAAQVVTHIHNPISDGDSQPRRLPEDEPWPGIEDREHMSDGENIDPREVADGNSNASSQPSEYPSTQRAWPHEDDMAGFQIHEDNE